MAAYEKCLNHRSLTEAWKVWSTASSLILHIMIYRTAVMQINANVQTESCYTLCSTGGHTSQKKRKGRRTKRINKKEVCVRRNHNEWENKWRARNLYEVKLKKTGLVPSWHQCSVKALEDGILCQPARRHRAIKNISIKLTFSPTKIALFGYWRSWLEYTWLGNGVLQTQKTCEAWLIFRECSTGPEMKPGQARSHSTDQTQHRNPSQCSTLHKGPRLWVACLQNRKWREHEEEASEPEQGSYGNGRMLAVTNTLHTLPTDSKHRFHYKNTQTCVVLQDLGVIQTITSEVRSPKCTDGYSMTNKDVLGFDAHGIHFRSHFWANLKREFFDT